MICIYYRIGTINLILWTNSLVRISISRFLWISKRHHNRWWIHNSSISVPYKSSMLPSNVIIDLWLVLFSFTIQSINQCIKSFFDCQSNYSSCLKGKLHWVLLLTRDHITKPRKVHLITLRINWINSYLHELLISSRMLNWRTTVSTYEDTQDVSIIDCLDHEEGNQ